MKNAVLLPLSFLIFNGSFSIAFLLPTPYLLHPVLAQTIEDRRAQADRLFDQGTKQYKQGQNQQAIASFEQALTLYRELKEPQKEGHTLRSLSKVYSTLKNYPKAIEYQQQALELARDIRDRPLQLETLLMLATIYGSVAIEAHEKGDSAVLNQASNRAIQAAQTGLTLAQELNQPQKEAEALSSIGAKYMLLNNPTKSLEFFERALAIHKATQNKVGQVQALIQAMRANLLMGHAAQKQKDYSQSLKRANQILALADEALQLTRELDKPTFESQILEQQSMAYSAIGEVYWKLGNFGKAEEAARRAVKIAQRSESLLAQNRALAILSGVYNAQGEYGKLIKVMQQNLDIARRSDSFSEVYALLTTGNSYGLFGNLPRGIEFIRQALSKAEAIASQPTSPDIHALMLAAQTLALGSLSVHYRLLGEYDQALEFAQQRLHLARTMMKPEEELNALIDLGRVYATRQSLPQAIEATQQALAIAQALQSSAIPNQSHLEIDALIQLSQLYATQENHAKALESGQQALQIAQKSGKPELETKALSALVTAYAAQGNIARAFELLRQQTNLSRKLPNAITRSQALISLGNAYVALGDYQTSHRLFTEALSEAQKIQFAPTEAMAWQRLAFVAWAQGESRTAVERAEKGAAVAQDKIPQIEIQNNLLLSLSYGEVGDQPKAMKAAQVALAITRQLQDRNGERGTLTLLGSLHRRFGRLEEAIATYQSALALGQKTGSSIASSGNSGIYAGLARAYADLNQPQMAIVFYKQAINSIEDTRFKLRGLSPDLQQSFLEGTFDFGQVKTADIYRQLADLLISQGRIEEGQQVLELLKVQELSDFTRGTRSPIKLTELALNATEQQIRQKYQNLIVFGQRVKQCQPSECEQLKSQMRELQTQFDQYIQAIQNQITDGSIIRIDQRNRDFIASASKIVNAQPGTVMIYPLVMGDRIHLLWASAGGVLSSATCPMGETQLNKTISAFRVALRLPGDPSTVQKLGKKLYDCLIRPIETKGQWQANQVRHLVIAPDRAINYIPLAALFDGKQYLIQKYAVSNVLNAGLTDVSDRLPPNPNVLGLGISEAIENFSPLPHVETEIKAIVKPNQHSSQGIYPGLVFLNQAFTRSTLESNLKGHNIVHIATHGEFDSTNPNDSFLLVSSGKKGKGERYAISQIKFLEDLRGVHLVILSACETALGELAASGLEIQGISSYFVQDKAKAVIASLWKVDDASTSYLMQQFYKNLAHSTSQIPMTKTEALRQAQLSLLQGGISTEGSRGLGVVATSTSDRKAPLTTPGEFTHPYYWAPFILIGNGL